MFCNSQIENYLCINSLVMIIEKELGFLNEFFPLITERCVCMVESMRNGIDISEADMDIMREVHKWWFEGRFGFTKDIDTESAISSESGVVLPDKSSDNKNGMLIVNKLVKSKKIIK